MTDQNREPLTPEEKAELDSLEAEFEARGGRGVELADRIDALRNKRDGVVGLKRYRASVTVTFIGTFIVEAADEDDAWDVANKMQEDALDVQDILEGGLSWTDEEIVDVEEIKEDVE